MDKFNILASPNCRNAISDSNRFICSGMSMKNSIMLLKDHLGFKYVHGNRFPGQFVNKIICL